MRKTLVLLGGVILVSGLPFLLTGCSCGFDCSGSSNNDNGNNSASLTLGFSDSLPEELSEVVLNVTAITFRRSGANDTIVNNFTISGLDETNASDFQVDLLDYQGSDQLLVLQGFRLEPGQYEQIFLDFIVGSNSNTYVTVNEDSSQQPLDVPPDGRLVLNGFDLAAGPQTYTIDFELARSLSLDDTSGYELTAEGIRLVNNDTDASLSGVVESTLLDTELACVDKAVPTEGSRVYLYRSSNVTVDQMTDVFTSDSEDTPDPGSVLAPFAVASVKEDDEETGVYRYAFGFLPTGQYTLGFSCNTSGDDSVRWDDLDIPLPDNQIYRIDLSEPGEAVCDLVTDPAEDAC